jgi:hypothetical protein
MCVAPDFRHIQSYDDSIAHSMISPHFTYYFKRHNPIVSRSSLNLGSSGRGDDLPLCCDWHHLVCSSHDTTMRGPFMSQGRATVIQSSPVLPESRHRREGRTRADLSIGKGRKRAFGKMSELLSKIANGSRDMASQCQLSQARDARGFRLLCFSLNHRTQKPAKQGA